MTTPLRRRKAAAARTRKLALGYIRVSTEEQVDSGAGVAAQEATIRAEAERRGWDLEIHYELGVSAKTPATKRPVSSALFARLEAGEADILLVTKLDRLSRSLMDTLVPEMSRQQNWALVIIDLGIDPTTPSGALTVHMQIGFGNYERELIGQRTREALAAKKAAGVRLGRPSTLSDELVSRIISDRDAGGTLQAIAEGLNADGIPTARSASVWTHATVRKVLLGQQAERLRSQG